MGWVRVSVGVHASPFKDTNPCARVHVCVWLFNYSARSYFIYNKQVNIAHPKCDFSTFFKEPWPKLEVNPITCLCSLGFAPLSSSEEVNLLQVACPTLTTAWSPHDQPWPSVPASVLSEPDKQSTPTHQTGGGELCSAWVLLFTNFPNRSLCSASEHIGIWP